MSVQHRKSTDILELEPALKVLPRERKRDGTLARIKAWVVKMRLTLGEDALRASLKPLLEKFLKNGTSLVISHHTKLLVPASAYTSETMGPTFLI